MYLYLSFPEHSSLKTTTFTRRCGHYNRSIHLQLLNTLITIMGSYTNNLRKQVNG